MLVLVVMLTFVFTSTILIVLVTEEPAHNGDSE